MTWQQKSRRRSELPADWPAMRDAADERNPNRICHWCGQPGGSDLDHKLDPNDHSPENLDWIHGLRSFGRQRALGLRPRNCHGEKSSGEGHRARAARRERRPPDVHPALR